MLTHVRSFGSLTHISLALLYNVNCFPSGSQGRMQYEITSSAPASVRTLFTINRESGILTLVGDLVTDPVTRNRDSIIVSTGNNSNINNNSNNNNKLIILFVSKFFSLQFYPHSCS